MNFKSYHPKKRFGQHWLVNKKILESLVKSGSFSAFEVNDSGVVNLGGFTEEPSVVEGGFYYNTDENEFYLGTG